VQESVPSAFSSDTRKQNTLGGFALGSAETVERILICPRDIESRVG
jgi:hypothetical protein